MIRTWIPLPDLLRNLQTSKPTGFPARDLILNVRKIASHRRALGSCSFSWVQYMASQFRPPVIVKFSRRRDREPASSHSPRHLGFRALHSAWGPHTCKIPQRSASVLKVPWEALQRRNRARSRRGSCPTCSQLVWGRPSLAAPWPTSRSRSLPPHAEVCCCPCRLAQLLIPSWGTANDQRGGVVIYL